MCEKIEKAGNRHLENSFEHFKKYVGKDFISPKEITENFCKGFKKYLLERYHGETPQNYFARFKWVIRAATKDRYFLSNPVENVYSTANPSLTIKENIEADEYQALLNAPCNNQEVNSAFLFSLYTGLRWVDVKIVKWEDIKGNVVVTRIIQKKTGKPVVLALHTISRKILDQQWNKMVGTIKYNQFVFHLPTANGANKVLKEWILQAGIEKHITWYCLSPLKDWTRIKNQFSHSKFKDHDKNKTSIYS